MDMKQGWWAGFKRSLKQFREDLEKDSVANSGSAPSSCCHVLPEELERRREAYSQSVEKNPIDP
jgi:hypothetical protein